MDYGYTDRVEMNSLYEWDKCLSNLAFQAIKCFVYDSFHIPEEFEQRIHDGLRDKLINRVVEIYIYEHIFELESETPYIVNSKPSLFFESE